MSHKVVCDRCGEDITFGRWEVIKTRDSDEVDWYEHDLCKRCSDDFRKFLHEVRK